MTLRARRGTEPTPTALSNPTVIRPQSGWSSFGFREMWHYRELLAYLAWRDLIVRYKQAVFGVAWAVVQPLVAMVIFTIVFGRIAKLPTGGIPYPVFSFVALVPWQFFSSAVQRSSGSLVANANLLTKVYFPRLTVPLAATIAILVDLAISLVVLGILMALYGIAPTWNVVWLPAFVLLALTAALAVGIWLAALNVLYRDVQYVVPLLLQVWMYASPVVYSATMVSGRWTWIYGLNPMAGVIVGFRWALLGTAPPNMLLAASVVGTIAILVSGLAFFKRAERVFADVV